MLKVGIVGFGFMGQTHYKCWKKVKGAKVTAICDVNPNIEEDTKKATGNIGDASETVDLSSLNVQTFEVDRGPTDVIVSPNSRTAYVVNELSNSIVVAELP